MTLQDFFVENEQLQNQWAAGKNTKKPEALMLNSHDRVWWKCESGHFWQAPVYAVKRGDACPYCAGRKAIPGETDLATIRPDILEQWDYAKNTHISPSEILPSAHDKVWWKCELGHSWQARVFSRTKEKSSGCPYCAGRLVLAGFNDLATLKPKLAEEWYQVLNSELRPEDVTLGSNKKVWWQCREGHVWRAAIYSRTRRRGSGCPGCAGTVKQRSSTLEITKTSKKGQSLAEKETYAASINI